MKIISKNKKAYFNYQIIDEFEAGIVITGEEVKSIRKHACSIKEAYAKINENLEMFLYNMTVDHYKFSNSIIDTKRRKKLLLHKYEIKRIARKIEEKGLTLIPLMLYINDRNLIKLKIGLCRGKKQYNKKEEIKRRDFEREQARSFKNFH